MGSFSFPYQGDAFRYRSFNVEMLSAEVQQVNEGRGVGEYLRGLLAQNLHHTNDGDQNKTPQMIVGQSREEAQ
jgi:hypothetical protein